MKKLPKVIVLTVPEDARPEDWASWVRDSVYKLADEVASDTLIAQIHCLADSARLVDLEAMAHDPDPAFNPYYAEGVATACRKIAGVD
jgi:hypothetical protein